MAKLSYERLGDGRVSLSLVDEKGFKLTVDVSESYIKARAWAILNDLEPAEVEAMAEAPCDPKSVTDADVASAIVNIPLGGMTIKDKALLAVAEGALNSLQVSAALNLRREDISPRLNDLAKAGLLIVVQKSVGRGGQTFYGLSRAGVIRARRLGLALEAFAPPPKVAA